MTVKSFGQGNSPGNFEPGGIRVQSSARGPQTFSSQLKKAIEKLQWTAEDRPVRHWLVPMMSRRSSRRAQTNKGGAVKKNVKSLRENELKKKVVVRTFLSKRFVRKTDRRQKVKSKKRERQKIGGAAGRGSGLFGKNSRRIREE